MKEATTYEVITPIFEAGTPDRIARMTGTLTGSEILKIAADIRAMLAEGKSICNLTVGDFNPRQFPIPSYLAEQITEALERGETNYPPSDGMLELRKAIQQFYLKRLGLDYPLASFLITAGARPAIYGSYRTVVDPGDTVVYPIPSWNNNHYCHLTSAKEIGIACQSKDFFLPTGASLGESLRGARLLSLCSPLNPTGTAFTREALEGICDLVLEENERRGPNERPLYLLYDQVYWMLTFGGTEHFNPVQVRPAMAPYVLMIDGISKAFAATGVRVGWAVVPPDLAPAMSNLLGHVGAWAPRAEQVATARLLLADEALDSFHATMVPAVESRLDMIYSSLMNLKIQGFPVDAIPPMGAIYLTAQFNLLGKRSASGHVLETNEDVRRYLLEAAQIAMVPFQAFGAKENTGWFRLSVGAVSLEEIEAAIPRLERAMQILS